MASYSFLKVGALRAAVDKPCVCADKLLLYIGELPYCIDEVPDCDDEWRALTFVDKLHALADRMCACVDDPRYHVDELRAANAALDTLSERLNVHLDRA